MSKAPIFTKNINEDGTIDDTVVETYLAPITAIRYDLEDHFIRLHIDTGVTDTEARLSIQDLRMILNEFEVMKEEEE